MVYFFAGLAGAMILGGLAWGLWSIYAHGDRRKNVRCGWCGTGMRYDPTLERGKVSTGICASCADELLSEHRN